ncbi:hypothetical protein CC1G_03443 [Coprinopsis cinerea okayama7|uniref:Uncharacterized protein n=1 Tax=Coprinopsis cinerea (strain Okayama-7 / 130 / ATCC MYA-4618 / FGSC 9003) TaxID=240176 RepID=A8NQR5_COPC7|nr:hypothetical protein CC1G_03443 [Coprinopsis cinerea okayama7\|eukprot:XP_001835661.1 hypothetical protein CC1G_03443 [Coprinopsis cinerea okayama7\
MSRKLVVLLSLLSSLSFAAPVRREVPQEHSHERFLRSVQASLQLNNPAGIVDSVFGLLGDGAAATGAGTIEDPACLQQATADQAFTNAKAAGDVQGMVDALIYRALERNTLQVGLASDPCTSLQAVNPEIAAIQQHQDPASPNAAEINKAITLELARQIKSVGGNPQDAILSGTFAPGDVNDPTGRGNSCNDIDDAEGCIFTQNLLVPDATPEEIEAAVADVEVGEPPQATETADVEEPEITATATCPPPRTVTVTAVPTATEIIEEIEEIETAPIAIETGVAGNNKVAKLKKIIKIIQLLQGGARHTATRTVVVAQPTQTAEVPEAEETEAEEVEVEEPASGNLQKFTGALGGQSAPRVIAGGRGFQVEGNAEFQNLAAAISRSCDVQKNRCANVANSAEGRELGLSVSDCDEQNAACRAANA